MGKLGNKLKSTIFVLIAVLAAVAAFPFAANLFGIKQTDYSNLHGAYGPGGNWSPSDYTTNTPEVYSSVVAGGYGPKIIKTAPTLKEHIDTDRGNAKVPLYPRYRVLNSSGTVVLGPVASLDAYGATQSLTAGTYTVQYQLYWSGINTTTGAIYYQYSTWKNIGNTTVTRYTYTALPATANFWFGSNVTNGTIKLGYPYVSPFKGMVYTFGTWIYDATNTGKAPTSSPDSYGGYYSGKTTGGVFCTSVGTWTLYAACVTDAYYSQSQWFNTGVSVQVTKGDNGIISESFSSDVKKTVAYNGEAHYYDQGHGLRYAGGDTQYALSTSKPTMPSAIEDPASLYASNVGTYSIWTRTAGNDNYGETDWYEASPGVLTITKSDLAPGNITDTPTATSNSTYGTGDALFSGSVTVSGGLAGGGSVSYGYSTATGATEPSKTVTNLSDITTSLGVGTYTLWYKITGDSNWNDSKWFKGAAVTVSQGKGTLDDGDLSFYTSNKQYYTGSGITIFTAGKAAGGVGGTVYYAVTTTGNKPNDTNTGGSTSLPTVTYPGTYTLYYRRASSDNYTAVGWTKSGLGEKIIYKAGTDISAAGLAVVSSTVTWKSGGVQLFKGNGTITKGSGTIKYALSLGNSASYAPTVAGESDITKVKAENIGTYYLWYKLEGKKVNNIQCWDDHVWEDAGLAAVQVTAAASKLKPYTLAKYTTTAKYTGSPLQLFKNEAAFEYGAGTILYGLSTKSDVMTIPNITYNSAAAAQPTNAGPWYLWYKSTGSGNYASTEWVYSGISNEIAKGGQNDFTNNCAVEQSEYTFNNEYRYPFKGKITVTTGNTDTNAITYGWATTSNGEPTTANTAKATTSLKIKNAGTYYLFFSVAGNDNYEDTGWKPANKSVKINPQTAPKLDGSNISVKTGLEWNGSSQYVCPNSTYGAVCTNGDLSKFVYCLNTSSAWSNATKIGEWGTVLSLAAEKPGTYYIFAKTSSEETTENTSHIDSPVYLSKSVIINKKDDCGLSQGNLAVITTGAVYFNAQEAQALFKGAGSTDSNGKIQYALGSDSAVTGSWTTDISAVKLAAGQKIGIYYLWYKVDATEYCTAVPVQRVKLSDGTYLRKTISKLTAPTFTANESLVAQSLTYNKSSQKLFEAVGVENAAANSTGDGDTIYYYVTGTSATPTVAVTNANVKTDVGDLVSTNVGTGEFYLWYQQNGTTNCAATTKWVYSNLCTKMARASVDYTGEMTGKTLDFNNGNQVLFSSNLKPTFKNAEITDGTIVYCFTTDTTAPALSKTGVALGEVQQSAAGDYYGWWKFTGSANFENSEAWQGGSSVKTVINKSAPGLDNKGTNPLKALTNLTYTGNNQDLFSGAGNIITTGGPSVGQSIEYGYSTALSAPAPISSTVTTDLSALQAQDGWTSATEQIKYFLWYRLTESANCSGTDWAKVKDANNADVFATIGKASLSITPNLAAECNYDGQSHAVFAQVPTLTSTVSPSHFDVTYKVVRTYIDGRTWDNVYSNYAEAAGTAAATIKVYAKWTLKNVTGTAVYQYSTQESYKEIGTTRINQIAATPDNVTVSGLTHNTTLKLNADAVCTPYSSVAVDLKVCGQSVDNGPDDCNKLNYILTTSSTAPSSGYTPYTTAADLNTKIKAETVNQATKWYLWFQVVQHLNLTTGSTILGDSFTVAGFDDVTLDGLTMTGATSDIKAGTVTYSGSPYKLATGTIKATQKVTLGTTYYAFTNDATTKPASSSWTTDLSTLEVTAAKDTPYYLWVKWDASPTVAASNGVIYGTLQVNKYTAEVANLEFTGLSFSSWGTPDASHVFSKPFKNGAYTLATQSATPTVTVTNAEIASDEFGTLSFAVGTETEASTSYYGIDAIGQLGIKDCGTTHYIWVKWTGGDNIKAGSTYYRYDNGSNVVVPKFKITQVTSLGTNSVTLQSTNIATAKSSTGSVFAYDFSTSTKKYTAKSQALFNATSTTPSINFNGAAYSGTVSYQYLISDKSSGITASTSGWVSSIASAMASAVKSAYYLWVKVTINDKNVNLATTINTNKTAKIVAASSFVHSSLQPQKKTNKLVADGSHVDLITPSAQISPAVEYSLNGTTFSAYGDTVRPTAAGTYKIYYRGAATSDGSFVAESKPSTGYPYYQLTIYPQDATAIIPQSKDVVYNGASRTASELITKGYAVIGDENRELEYAWNTNTAANYVSFDKLAAQKDAGEYTLWYRYVAASGNESSVSPSSITVKIQRAAITMQTCTWTKVHEYNYNAADHTFLEAALDYTINGTSIKYSTGAGSQTMGKIYYALTNSNTNAPAIEDDCWKTNYADLKARKVGSYYIWVRVDDSGKNHKGIDPVCYNKNYAIKINLASEQKYNQSTVTVIKNLRFNAEGQALISGFALKVSVPNSAETSQYKVVPSEDYAYTAYYYLSDDASVYPSIEGDLITNGWSTDYTTLKQTNADTYYLIVYLKVTDGSCIKSEVVAFTNYAAIIAPAKHSDIKLSGINATPKEFSGDEQAIASGELIASIPTTNKVIDKEITDIKYCFVGEGEFAPTKTSTWYGSLADAKETQVGKYQLYVWLTTTTNIDQSTDYIVPVLGDSLTEITPIDGHTLNIVGLEIAKETDLVYTGEEVRLITSAPRLQMRNGSDLEGKLGAVKYYISGDRDEFTTVGTTKEDRAYNLSEVTELNAGTYYIWVAFEAGENHTSIDRKYVAKVTITPATGDNIELSGININQALTYNGQNQDLITTEVVQNINGNTLNAENVESVEYGYSNDPEIQPASYVSEIADLEARDADKYYIWIKVTTKSNSVTNQKNITDYVKLYSEEEFAQIFKATLSLSNIGISENEGLVYIGQAQSLATFIEGKTTITLDNNGINLNTDELNPDLVCEWGLSEDTITAPTTWVVDINELEGTNAGDYYLWVRVENESKNFNAFKAKHYKTINIGQADICLKQDLVVKTGLKYTGTEQNLVESAPIIKFRAVNGEYIEATGLVVKYAILAEGILTGDIEEIKATDAKEYEIYYYIEADAENNNWELTEFTADVEIAKVAADIEGIGLSAVPEAKEELTYNGTIQDLITFGALANIEGDRGAGLEGSQIVFFYNDAPNIKYSYSFNQSENKHVWLNDAVLPGKQNVGTYEITYYVTASTTGNFVESERKTLTVEITSCDVQWEQRPTAKTGLKYPGYNIPLIEAGVLTATENEELYVEYTLDAPEVGQRTWQKDMPEADKAGNYTIWYRVHTSENYNFVGTEDNTTGEKLEIVVESYTLSVVSLPQSKQMMYTGESQEIIFEGAELSTDEGNLTENAPFFEYSLDGNVYRPVLELKNTGTYDVYYRINYNDTIFTFVPNEVCESDGRLTLLRTTITINKLTFEENTLKAVYEDGEMTYINGSYPFMNEEIAEHIQYFYRKSGTEGWTPWEAGALENAELGTYEFKLKLTAPNDDANFYDFEQTGEYSTHIVKRNRAVEIVMGDYNAQHGFPTIRAWVDLDGATTYETAAFRVEGTVAKNGKLTLGITDVSEANNNALIRVEVVSAGYFYMSSETLAEATKLSILLSSEIVNQTAINQGLTEETTYLYVYELYKITYNANGGEGTIEEDWKWHGIDLTLKENTYTKTTENEIELITNGWNDSITGSGKHYGNGSMTYTDNETVVLYAQYFAIDETIYRVEWIIDNGTNRYAVARDGSWYNTSEDTSRGGQLIKEGDLIILPQVNVDKDGNDLAEIFGGYILGWYTEDENMPYEFGMTATRDIVFVALLNEDASDYIECKFYNKDNEEVHSSGKVANGASAYMALSGLDYNTLQTYLENFEAWNELNNAETLDSSKVESGVFNYSLEEKAEEPEPKPEPEPEPEPEIEKSTNTNGIMFVIIGVGVAVSAAMIVIYMIIRKRRR